MRMRRASGDDLDKVVALQKAAYAENEALLGARPLPLEADYAKILQEMEAWLCESERGVDGALILEWRPDDLLIWSVAAHPQARSAGVGKRLLALAHERARDMQRGTIRLYTASVYARNLAWYARNGFREEWRERLGDRTRVHMVKTLD
ncbi:MAG: GNAT family N-acetyltransferase [Hyphomicrobiales bacterium]|nr:GNAT family N-acetyltransferase [Hyphomicrobiales bacterium]